MQVHWWKNIDILIQISLKIVHGGPVDNKSTLVQVMTKHSSGDKALLEPMMTNFLEAYIRHEVWMS